MSFVLLNIYNSVNNFHLDLSISFQILLSISELKTRQEKGVDNKLYGNIRLRRLFGKLSNSCEQLDENHKFTEINFGLFISKFCIYNWIDRKIKINIR